MKTNPLLPSANRHVWLLHAIVLLGVLTLIMGAPGTATAQQPNLRTSALSAGANTSNGGAVVLQSTLGQAIVGSSASNAYQVNAGFWFQARPPAIVAVNQPPTAPQILTPQSGEMVTIGGSASDPLDPNTRLEITWSEATDPEGDALVYYWELGPTEDFANRCVGLCVGVEGNTSYSPTFGLLAPVIDRLGGSLGGSVTLWHRAVAYDGQNETFGTAIPITFVRGTLTADEEEAETPSQFRLEPNYPNPFNPATTIAYDLPTSAEVILTVFDVQGREVRRFAQGMQSAGRYEVRFEARELASGVYMYRLVAGSYRATQTMLLLK